MKKKTLIELFIYIIVVIVAITLLMTYKPKQKLINIDSDFKIGDQRGDFSGSIPVQQPKH